MAIDRRSKAVDKVANDRLSWCHLMELISFIVIELKVLFCPESALFKHSKRNQIYVGIEDRFDISLYPLNFYWLCSVDSHYFHSISRSDSVHIVIIADNSEWVGSLSLRHILWQFLKFNVLFVCELTEVVDQFEGIFVFAVIAVGRLLYSWVLKNNVSLLIAVRTFEMSCFHLRIYFWCSYYYSSKLNKAVNVLGPKVFYFSQLF